MVYNTKERGYMLRYIITLHLALAASFCSNSTCMEPFTKEETADHHDRLCCAVHHGDIDDVITLLEGDPEHDIDQPGLGRKTPMKLAIENDDVYMVQTLLTYGAQADTHIHEAILSGNRDIAIQLIGYMTHLHIADGHGNTPMHVAAQKGESRLIFCLYSYGAGIDIQNKSGLTPLCCAILYQQEECARILLTYGASLSLTDKDGNTPIDRAYSVHNKAICSSLRLIHHAMQADNGYIDDEIFTMSLKDIVEHGAMLTARGYPELGSYLNKHGYAHNTFTQELANVTNKARIRSYIYKEDPLCVCALFNVASLKLAESHSLASPYGLFFIVAAEEGQISSFLERLASLKTRSACGHFYRMLALLTPLASAKKCPLAYDTMNTANLKDTAQQYGMSLFHICIALNNHTGYVYKNSSCNIDTAWKELLKRDLFKPDKSGMYPLDVAYHVREYGYGEDVLQQTQYLYQEALGTCPICKMDAQHENITILPCSHMFHASCIETWLQRLADNQASLHCPICRKSCV